MVELLARMDHGGRELAWPVAVVPEFGDERRLPSVPTAASGRSTTDDGVRCAVEYNCVRWGIHDLPAQAGLGVYERGADGGWPRPAHDDAEPPAELS